MKLICAMFFLSSALYAGYYEQRIGNQTYGNDSSTGINTYSQRIGNMEYTTSTDRSGRSTQTTCQTIGNQTYCN